jgi:hypothetical protein
MKTLLKCAVVAFIASIAATASFSQEWTKAQKELWQIVEDSWAKWKAGDIQGSLVYLHEKYQGWNDQSPLPITKEMTTQRSLETKDNFKIDYFSLNPARIVITENAAVVDYYYTFEATFTRGEKKELIESNGQNAEFYVKEGGKWLLLGDMTTIKERVDKRRDRD